jgi:hypothetical protein
MSTLPISSTSLVATGTKNLGAMRSLSFNSAGNNANSAIAKKIVYVDANALPGGDGSNWGKALKTIPENLAAGTEVWITGGTYAAEKTAADSANSTDARDNSFKLSAGVKYYGGFTGTESNIAQRSLTAKATVLTGERGKPGIDDNSYTVVTGAKGALFDGFTVRAGNATPTRARRADGGSISGGNVGARTPVPSSGALPLPSSGAPTMNRPPQTSRPPPLQGGSTPPSPGAASAGGNGQASPVHTTPEATLADAKDGRVVGAGGGMSITAGMTVSNTIIEGNKAIKGGGFYAMTATAETFPPGKANGTDRSSEVVFDNVKIRNNESSDRGGAGMIELGTKIAMNNSIVEGNSTDKGNLYFDFMASGSFANTTVRNNKANSAAGIGSDGGGRVTIAQSTITGNAARDEGGGLYLGTGEQNNAVVVDSTIKGNTSGGSGADSYAYHGNSIRAVRSVIADGDVTSDGKDAKSSRMGADMGRSLTANELRTVNQEAESMLPQKAGAPTTAPGSSASTPGRPVQSSERIVYVDANAKPAGNGSSWASSYSSLDAALKDAAKDGAQVWVAKGAYKPKGTDRTATFKLADGVRLFGGFQGYESSVRQRDANAKLNGGMAQTLLSGDIGKSGDASDNAYHVVTGGNKTQIDCVTVAYGNANGAGYDGQGGGMINYARGSTQGEPTREKGFTDIAVTNSVFIGNQARDGGAMYNYGNSDISMQNVEFNSNSAQNGGAIMDRVGVHTTLDDVRFKDNKADKNGGAYYVDYGSRVKGNNVTATANNAGTDGGGFYAASRASQLENSVIELVGGSLKNNKAGRSGNSLAINDMSKAYLPNGNAMIDYNDVAVTNKSSLTETSAPAETFKRKATKAPPPQMQPAK